MVLPRIIGVSGKIGCGKTAFSKAFIDKFPSYEILNFGGILKKELSENYQFPLEWTYDQKLKLNVINPATTWETIIDYIRDYLMIDKKHIGKHNGDAPELPKHNMTVREALQWYGTDFRRKNDPNYWIKRMHDQLKHHPWAIIDDVRFRNEANMIRSLGGILIRLEPYPEWAPGKFALHPSEIDLDDYPYFDITLYPKYGKINQAIVETVKAITILN